MKIQIRPRGITLTKTQSIRLEHKLGIELARYGERIDRVVVALSNSDQAGCKRCAIEVRIKAQLVNVEHSDTDVFTAVEHASKRAARSLSRALETSGLIRR